MIHKTKSHPTQSRGRPNTALQKALDLHRKGQFAPAAKAFHSILRLQPKQYGIWLLYIESLLLSEQHAAAETAMQQCRGLGFNTPELDALASKIGLPPKHREQSLIDIFQQDGAVELAARMFIAQYPNWPLGWDILGSHFHREGDYAQAIQVRTEAAARFPEYVDFQVKLALSLQALERLVEAETVMQKAFTQAPTRVDILAHVGYLRQLQGNLRAPKKSTDNASPWRQTTPPCTAISANCCWIPAASWRHKLRSTKPLPSIRNSPKRSAIWDIWNENWGGRILPSSPINVRWN